MKARLSPSGSNAAGALVVAAMIAGTALPWGCSGDRTVRPEGQSRPADAGREDSHPRPNVLLVVLDTVRRDRLSCYGYERPTTPALDEIAARGVRFENVYSNSSWTLPAHASMFTGHYPMAHGATQEHLTLSSDFVTLAEILAEAGYRTFGCSANPVASRSVGLAQGFETFIETFRTEYKARHAVTGRHPNNAAFAEFLAMSSREQPFFAFINYIEAHLPYAPPEPFLSRFLDAGIPPAEVQRATQLQMGHHYLKDEGLSERQFAILSRLYDAEIAYLDQQVAEMLEFLERDGRLDNTLVIITSDHGENLGEHGHFAHVFDIHNTLLRVPMIVLFPDGSHAGEVRSDVAQLLDLFPSVLSFCGVPYGRAHEGRDLFAAGAASPRAVTVAEYYYPRQVLSLFPEEVLRQKHERFAPFMRRLRAVQDGETKLVWSSTGGYELYDVRDDPREARNLLTSTPGHPAQTKFLDALAALVEKYRVASRLGLPPDAGSPPAGFEEQSVDPELQEKLRSLGYVR